MPWYSMEELAVYGWDKAELAVMNRPTDRNESHKRAWLRRLLWNLRAMSQIASQPAISDRKD